MADFTIKGLIEILLKGTGGVDAKKQLDGAGKAGEQAAKGIDRAATSTEKFGSMLQRYFGGAILARFIQSSILDVSKFERQLGAVSERLRTMGVDSEQAMPRIRDFLEALEDQAGVLDDESLPAFQKFLGIVGDVEGALYNVRLAAELTRRGLGSMGENTDRVAAIIQGKGASAMTDLGLATRDASGELKGGVESLQAVIDAYGDFSQATQDNQSQVESFTVQWDRFKDTVGEGFAPVLRFINFAFENILKSIKAAGNAIGTFVSMGIQGLTGLGRVASEALNWRTLLADPGAWWKNLTAVAKRELELQVGIFEDGAARSTEIIEGAAKKQVDVEKGKGAALAAARRKDLEDEADARRKAADEARKDAAERVKFEQETSDKILAQQIAAAEEGTQHRLALELEMLARMRERALSEAKRLKADVALVEELFRQSELALHLQHADLLAENELEIAKENAARLAELDRELLDSEIALAEEGGREKLALLLEQLDEERDARIASHGKTKADRLKIDQTYANRKLKIERDLGEAEKKLAKQVAEDKRDKALLIADASVQLARALFGENKAIAVSEAIVNTAVAVTRALGEGGPPLAALVAALGAVQISKIMSTNIGSSGADFGGFGGAGGDTSRAIPSSGQSQSVPREQTVFQQQQSTQDNRVIYNVHVQGHLIDGARSMRRLSRSIDRAKAQDQARTLR